MHALHQFIERNCLDLKLKPQTIRHLTGNTLIETRRGLTAMDWAGLVLICFVLPAVLTYAFGLVLRKIGWIKEGDLTLESADDMVKAE